MRRIGKSSCGKVCTNRMRRRRWNTGAYLSSAAPHPHPSAHGAAEVLHALLSYGSCMLLLLQIDLRIGGSLPSVTAVLRPISGLRVVAVDVTILPGIKVVRARSNPGASRRIVSNATPANWPLTGVCITRVSCADSLSDACLRVIPNRSTPRDSVAGIGVEAGSAASYADGAALDVLESGSICRTIVPTIGIRPGGTCTRVRRVAPAAVYVRADVASIADSPGRPPTARPVVPPRPPPRIIIWVIVGIADTDRDAPSRL